jgi:FlaA1/EpsC-like NDP-sugar epimerase
LVIDLSICLFSLILAYLLRFNFAAIPSSEIKTFPTVFSFVISLRAVSFSIARIYRQIVRYVSSHDAQRIFITTLLGSVFFALANLFSYYFLTHTYILPYSILIIEFMASTFLMISLRLAYKSIYMELKNPKRLKNSIIIFGAGEAGMITKRTLDRDEGLKYKVVAFIDDDVKKQGNILEGITIYSYEKLHQLLKQNEVAHLIISSQHISPKRKEEIVELCLHHNTKILNVPPVSNWINGELSFKQIKKIKIEELLERNTIPFDIENSKRHFYDKVILVTGAAGSIGSELVRQISQFNPKKIILIDSAESPLYEIELELKSIFHLRSFEVVVADIRNEARMNSVFQEYRPQIVFHSAAYKHVPMMESHPVEAVKTNVAGTKIVADLSVNHSVEKFVMISTDKAVNPTNVMGASKRIAEIYVQALTKTSSTQFITTRFGNVMGSNGSAIQLFHHQIQKGGPITITHPEITRYFMTIPEACQLVLEAGAMGKGGEIFLFDMGQSVKIVDLAKKMVQLAGLTLGKDMQIIYTGLRPGEKLYEELLATKENSLPTHHPQIMIANVRVIEEEETHQLIAQLIQSTQGENRLATVALMKKIVPEFISNNSTYESLDKL